MRAIWVLLLVGTVFLTDDTDGYRYRSLNTALNQISINEPKIYNPPLVIPNIGPIVRRLLEMAEKEKKKRRRFRLIR